MCWLCDLKTPAPDRPDTPGRWNSRRGFLLAAAAASALPAAAQVDVGRASAFAKLVPAEEIEASAAKQYQQMLRQAASQGALAPPDHPQLLRLRRIASDLIPFAAPWNPRSRQWTWEINLLDSKQINAFCMPGGKIAFYMGILQELQLNDDEVAQIMGHEIAHALREHARERMGKSFATRGALELGSALLGLGDLGRVGANVGTQLITMTFGREDETEADKIGLDMAARGGYNPQAGVLVWFGSGNHS